jgi:hypothetical protein
VSVIGPVFAPDKLYLTRGRDFKWAYKLVDVDGVETDFPPGELFFEILLYPVLKWPFSITGSEAVLKIESEEADLIPNRTKWQLVFLPEGEPAGGDPVALGTVKVQGE